MHKTSIFCQNIHVSGGGRNPVCEGFAKNIAYFQASSSPACAYAATDLAALSFMSSPDGPLGFRAQSHSLEDSIQFWLVWINHKTVLALCVF